MVSELRSSGHPRRQRVHGGAGHVTKSEVLLAEFSFNEIFFFIEREVLVLVWPASLLESGCRRRRLALGFPGLCEAGQVEPDK